MGTLECEILIARSIDAVLNSFECEAIDTHNTVQIVSLFPYGHKLRRKLTDENKERQSLDIKQNVLKSDIVSIETPICICEEPLEKVAANMCYPNATAVLCDLCRKQMVPGQMVWHCPLRTTIKHKNGYDTCLDCGQRSIDCHDNNSCQYIAESMLCQKISQINQKYKDIVKAFVRSFYDTSYTMPCEICAIICLFYCEHASESVISKCYMFTQTWDFLGNVLVDKSSSNVHSWTVQIDKLSTSWMGLFNIETGTRSKAFFIGITAGSRFVKNMHGFECHSRDVKTVLEEGDLGMFAVASYRNTVHGIVKFVKIYSSKKRRQQQKEEIIRHCAFCHEGQRLQLTYDAFYGMLRLSEVIENDGKVTSMKNLGIISGISTDMNYRLYMKRYRQDEFIRIKFIGYREEYR
eukprot:6400_1